MATFGGAGADALSDLIAIAFPVTDDGSIPGLALLDQPTVEALLKELMQSSAGWNSASAIGFAGLPAGIPLFLGMAAKIVQGVTGLPVDDILEPWLTNPVVGNLTSAAGSVFGLLDQYQAAFSQFLGDINFLDPDFDPTEAIVSFIELMLLPSGLIPELIDGLLPTTLIPGLDASQIVSGLFPLSQVANLATMLGGFGTGTSIISQLLGGVPNLASGTTGLTGWTDVLTDLFGALGNPTNVGSTGTFTLPGIGSIPLLSGLLSGGTILGTLIPGLDAAKIVSGILGVGLIPGLPTSKITSGTFAQSFVSGLPAMATNLSSLFASADFTSGSFDPLAAILPFLNVSGALGPVDIGGTAQGILDQFISGFTNSIGTGSALADAFNTANIIGSQSFLGKLAYDITQIFDNKSMTQGMLPSSVSTVGLDVMGSFTTLPTTPVTQSNTIIGFKRFEQAAAYNYVSWLGSGVSGLTAFYIDIWKYNAALNSFDWVTSTGDVLANLSPTMQYNIVQLDDEVAVEPGDILGGELIPVGGTHTVGALNSNLPNHPTVRPKNMGARKNMIGTLWQAGRGGFPFSDNFDVFDPTHWTPFGSATSSVTSSRLAVPSNNSGYESPLGSFVGGKVWVEVPQVAGAASTSAGVPTELGVHEAGRIGLDYARIYQIGGNLFFDVQVNGVVNQTGVAYNSTTHRWWQISVEDGVNFSFFTGPNGVDWNWHRDVPIPAGIDTTNMEARFFVGAWSDDFVRANSTTTVGTGWTNRRNIMGINTNAAYPVTTDDSLSIATWDVPASSDDMAARITLGALFGAGRDSSSVIIGANTSGECVGAYWDGANTGIFTKPAWATAETVRASSGAVTFTTGNDLEIRRAGNVYTVYKNNVATAVTWTDSTNIIPRDSNHRLTGIGGRNNALTYRRIDTFATTAPGPTPGLFDNYNIVPADNFTYSPVFPWIEFAVDATPSAGVPYHSPITTSYDSSTTYIVEDWVNIIEPVPLGGGGGGHDGAFGFSGEGGLGGNFGPYTVWTKGVHFNTGDAVTISRGAGGTTVGSDGQNGGSTTITVNGNTVTGTGGAGGDQSATTAAMVPGKSPGSVTYNGQPYVGGVQQNTSGANGVGPGGGGAGGAQPGGNGGTGANGRAWLRKIQ